MKESKHLNIKIEENDKIVCNVFADQNHVMLLLLNVLQYSIESKQTLSTESYKEICKCVDAHHTGIQMSSLNGGEKLTPAQRDRVNMMDLKILLTEIEPIINPHDDFKMAVEDRNGRIVIDVTFQVEYTQVVIKRIFNHIQEMYEDSKAQVKNYENHQKMKGQEKRKEYLDKAVRRMVNGGLKKEYREKIKNIKKRIENDKS